MRKTGIFLLTSLALASFPGQGSADTITLKSGEKIEGKITSETAAEITLEQKISAGITDSRVVPKTDVLKVDKEQPDEASWQAVKNSKLGANSLPSASYDAVLRSLQAFQASFPTSTHLAEAKKIVADFEQEKKRVDAGEVKLNGAWLSKQEAENERYQINGLLAFNYMKDQSTGGDLIGALNTFDALEKQFPGARIWPDAVELARRITASLKAEVERRLPMLAAEVVERAKGLELASATQRTEIEAALARDTAAAEAAMAAAQKRGFQWPPLLVHNEASLTALQTKVAAEISRLNAIEVTKIRQSLQLTDTAQKALAAKDFEGASTNLAKARELWSANELSERLSTIADAGKSGTLAVADAPAPAAAVEEAQPTQTAGTTSAASAPAAETAPETASANGGNDIEEPSFFATPAGIIFIIIGLAVVGAGVAVLRKRKARVDEAEE